MVPDNLTPITVYSLFNSVSEVNKEIYELVIDRINEFTTLDIKTGPWVAGGFIRRILDDSPLEEGDIDIYGTAPQIRQIIEFLENSRNYICIKESEYGVKFLDTESELVFNIVNMPVESIADLFDINITDFTINQVASDLHFFVAGETTIEDIKSRTLIPIEEMSVALTLLRTGKFIALGYSPSGSLCNTIIKDMKKYG